MVKGLELFRKHFEDFQNRYVLIGGIACTLLMEEVGLDFRSTKDFDVVLYIEALDLKFVEAFWGFVKKGEYQNLQKSTGKKLFYRFSEPLNADFPAMLELFSRKPDKVSLSNRTHLTPIPIDEEASSLSAILLDDDYYQFIHEGKREVDGLSVLAAPYLIPLKARACIDLYHRYQGGEKVDEKDIRKHKNNVFRLYQLLSENLRTPLPTPIRHDFRKFIDQVGNAPTDLKSLGIKNVKFEEIIMNLRQIYGIT